MKGLFVVLAAIVAMLVGVSPASAAGCSTAGVPPAQQALADQANANAAANVEAGAVVGDCTVSIVTRKTLSGQAPAGYGGGSLGTIACSVSGIPYYVSTPTYIHLGIGWSCNAIYNGMSGTAMVRDSSKVWSLNRPNSSGSTHLEFPGIAWYGYHNRAVRECPVYFAFIAYGFLGVCTTTSYI